MQMHLSMLNNHRLASDAPQDMKVTISAAAVTTWGTSFWISPRISIAITVGWARKDTRKSAKAKLQTKKPKLVLRHGVR